MIRTPTLATLRRYGLSEDEWLGILDRQNGACAICGQVPSSGILHIDHHHVPRWKAMKPEARKVHIRGLVCHFDNRFILARNVPPWRLRAAADYLEAGATKVNRE